MGLLGALLIGLFLYCLNRLKTRKDVIIRIIVLLIFACIHLIISIVFTQTGTTMEDKEGGWMVIILYLLIFGWRIVADIICIFSSKLEKQEENNETELQRNSYDHTR